jgi:hypothetical protein
MAETVVTSMPLGVLQPIIMDIELGTFGFLIYERLHLPEGLSLFEFLVYIYNLLKIIN